MNRLQDRLVAVLFCGLASAALAAPASAQRMQRRDLEMMVGEQQVIPGEGVRNYSEGVPGIADVRVTEEGRFVVVGLREGATTLLLIYDDGRQVQYRITVRDTTEEPSAIEARDNIRLDFYFVQLAENYGHQIGIGWPTSIGGGDIARFNSTINLRDPSTATATAVITGQPLPRIDLLEASGWARVQRQAAVVTANGSEAQFASNEEVNIPTSGLSGGDLQTVTFGAAVGCIPRYDRETGRIELQLNAEISDLTDGRGTGVPGRTVSTVNSVVNLEMGQAVVLGGLISESRNASQGGLPGLSQIPIIGIFFGTHQERREYTQNAIFVVPTVVDVVSQQARQRIVEAMEVYWDYTGGLNSLQLLPTPAGVPTSAHPDAPRAAPAAAPRPTPRPSDGN